MKITLSHVLSLLLCVALVLAAVAIGAYRGWAGEREAALSALSQDGDMRTLLNHRALDAGNLAVVAARHLPADNADLMELRSASAILLSGAADIPALLAADQQITEITLRFAKTLPSLLTMQESRRDAAYLAMFAETLGAPSGLTAAYATVVDDFNQQLSSSLMGKLAMMLGVEPLPAINATEGR